MSILKQTASKSDENYANSNKKCKTTAVGCPLNPM